MTESNNKHKALRSLISRLEKSETSSFDILQEQQYKALHNIVTHTQKYSPYFKETLNQLNISAEKVTLAEYIKQLPILGRRDIQKAGDDLFCINQKSHIEIQTSGSTGEPVKIRKANINHLFWLAHTFREHHWWQRNLSYGLAIIRAGIPAKQNSDWSSPLNILYDSGPSFTFPIDTDIKKQIAWLRLHEAEYLLTYPSLLSEIIRVLKDDNTTLPFIKQIRVIGETLHSDLRKRVENFFNVDVVDTYSSQEVGYIAMQCPDCKQYHIMAENLLVEVLNEHNEECQTGETGRLIITDLYNTVTPLIRYEIGDYAIVGKPCYTRPGLPTLKKILGRERNMLVLPDGQRYWPILGYAQYRNIADIKQYQVIQKDREHIQVRLVLDSPLTSTQKQQFTKILHTTLKYPFNIEYVYFKDKLPIGVNGKFEEFMNVITD